MSPIQLYTKEGCHHCNTIKSQLKARNIPFLEYEIGKDVSREWFMENYPDKGVLPVIVTESGVYGGPIEISHLLSEYRGDVGKQLLNE